MFTIFKKNPNSEDDTQLDTKVDLSAETPKAAFANPEFYCKTELMYSRHKLAQPRLFLMNEIFHFKRETLLNQKTCEGESHSDGNNKENVKPSFKLQI